MNIAVETVETLLDEAEQHLNMSATAERARAKEELRLYHRLLIKAVMLAIAIRGPMP
jgi:hypothetical protein